jgi:hypothetical protein
MDEPVLKNLWDADVPASDPRFALAVMAKIEHRRFRRELAMTVALTAAAIGLLALVMPSVEFTWREASYFGNLAILGILGAITFLVPQLWPVRD